LEARAGTASDAEAAAVTIFRSLCFALDQAGSSRNDKLRRVLHSFPRIGFAAPLRRVLITFSILGAVIGAGGCAGGSVQSTSQQNAPAGGEGNIASLSEVISANPNNANAFNLRGTAYAQEGQLDEALADLNRAIQINPNFFQAYNNRAVVFTRLNRPQDALTDYDRATAIAPDYQTAYVGRGKLHMAANRVPLALADFNKALQLDSNDPVARFNRGLIYQAQGKHIQAEDDFTLALGLRPETLEPHLARGKSLYAMGKYKAASDDLAFVVERDDKNFEAWTWLGFAHEKLGKRDEAVNAYRWALHVKPGHEPAEQGLQRLGAGRGSLWRRSGRR